MPGKAGKAGQFIVIGEIVDIANFRDDAGGRAINEEAAQKNGDCYKVGGKA